MSDRVELKEELMEDVSGGNLTYTWFGGQGTCGLNNNNKFKFSDKETFEATMTDCMIKKKMSDIETLQYMLDIHLIWR